MFGYNSFYELSEVNIIHDHYVNPEDRNVVTATLNQKGYVVNTELKLKRKNGKVITVLENAHTLLDDNGKVIGYEGILEDITARKVMEKKLQEYALALEKSGNILSELNIQKDKLFSILSLNLRSPFSSILGFCNILLKENNQLTSEGRLQFVSYIQEAARDQLELVNKLLDWSRLESGLIHMEWKEVDLHDVANKSIHSLIGIARQKQIKLQTQLPVNIVVRGDHQLLNQVFNNLIGNSLKFTPPGGTISIELIKEQDNHWVIGVRDTGVGIPQEDFHKLFKVEEKYTRKGLQGERGTGLGLPVVKEIIQNHYGDVEVKSSSDVGTLILISLPKSRPLNGQSILIVEEGNGMRTLHSRYIKRVSPVVSLLHTTDGHEAFQLAHEFNPKVIITDNDMHELDSQELVRNLKTDPTTKDIPIIIITGNDSDANREKLKRNGAALVLNKPVTPEQLVEALGKIEIGCVIAPASF
jgi:PAS domain S-box-containing protein